MKHIIKFSPLILCLFAASCGLGKRVKTEETDPEKLPFGPTGIPSEMRAKKNDATTDQGTPAAEVEAALAAMPKQEDIFYTSFDDNEISIPEMRELLAAPKKVIWETNEKTARRRALQEGKCLLMWFTNSQRSPRCKSLSAELLGKHEFGDWAKEHLIRMEVDGMHTNATGEKHNEQVFAAQNVTELRKRYKVIGTPTLILFSPRGELLQKIRGYKPGQANYTWGLIKHNVGLAEEEYASWFKSMEKRGYRRWQNTNGVQVIAKLSAYKDGQMLLTEPDGNRFRCKESQLCDADQDWIKSEKQKRGIQ